MLVAIEPLRFLDADTGREIDLPYVGEFSPDGKLMTFNDYDWALAPKSADSDPTRPLLYEVNTGKAWRARAAANSEDEFPRGFECQFSPNGTWLLATKYGVPGPNGESHARIRLWNLRDGTAPIDMPERALSTLFSQDDRFVVTSRIQRGDHGNSEMEFVVWDLPSFNIQWAFRKTGLGYRVIAFTPDGTGLIVQRDTGLRAMDEETVCFNIANGQERWSAHHMSTSGKIAGTRLVSLDKDEQTGRFTVVEIRNLSDGQLFRRFALRENDSLQQVAPDGRTMVVWSDMRPEDDALGRLLKLVRLDGLLPKVASNRLKIIDIVTGKTLGAVPVLAEAGSYSVYCSADSRCLAVCEPAGEDYRESRVRVWDIPPRKPLTWFAAASALPTMPLAWLARRRVRRLRLDRQVSASAT